MRNIHRKDVGNISRGSDFRFARFRVISRRFARLRFRFARFRGDSRGSDSVSRDFAAIRALRLRISNLQGFLLVRQICGQICCGQILVVDSKLLFENPLSLRSACLHRMLGALSLCGLCSKPSESRLICAQCKTICYCSKACQKIAWKTGHKGDCVPFNGGCEGAAASGPPCALFPRVFSASATDSSARSAFTDLARLHDAGDWRGVAAEELRFSEAAAALRVDAPTQSMYAYHILGSAYQSLQNYANAVKYFKHHLELATRFDVTRQTSDEQGVP